MKYSINFNTSGIFLPQEIEEWSLLLTRLEKSLYTQKSFNSLLADVPLEYSQQLIQVIKVNNLSLSDVSQLEELFSEIKASLRSLPVIKITLAFNPDLRLFEKIKESISEKLSHVVLDIQYDYSLIAGVTIAWKGLYKDYSLAKELNSYEKI
jgi:F0F1-type ATP synthase delta subunit